MAGLVEHAFPFLLDGRQAFFELRLPLAQAFMRRPCCGLLASCVVTRALNLIQQVLSVDFLRCHQTAGGFDHRPLEPKAFGDGQCVRSPGQPDRQPVGRPQAGEVELDAGIAHPGRSVGVGL